MGGEARSSFKPAAGLYWLTALLSWIVFRVAFGLRIRREAGIRKLRGPLLVIANHPCYFDPFILAVTLLPARINCLASHTFFRSRILRNLMNQLGAIPKVQFRTDMQAMKSMLRIIRSGGILGIYPEGQRSLDGSRQPVDEAIAKLACKLRCPVVAVQASGGYLTWPRWSQSRWRHGRIEIRASLLFTPQQLESMDVPDIQARIEAALDYQDYDWQRRRRHRFLSLAPARGLHVLCHQCPACGRDLAMQSDRFRLTCRFCGNQARMDTYGFLHAVGAAEPPAPDHQAASQLPRIWPDPCLWHQWQLTEMARRVRQPGFRLEFGARAEMLSDAGAIQAIGHGRLQLTAESLQFSGDPLPDQTGKPRKIVFPISNKAGISADYGWRFEVILADGNYRFILDDGQAVIMIADAIQAAQNPLDNSRSNRG